MLVFGMFWGVYPTGRELGKIIDFKSARPVRRCTRLPGGWRFMLTEIPCFVFLFKIPPKDCHGFLYSTCFQMNHPLGI